MLVEGELNYSTWTDQATGQKRYSTEVVAFNFQLLGSRQQGNGNAAPSYDYANTPQQQSGAPSDEEFDEELPF